MLVEEGQLGAVAAPSQWWSSCWGRTYQRSWGQPPRGVCQQRRGQSGQGQGQQLGGGAEEVVLEMEQEPDLEEEKTVSGFFFCLSVCQISTQVFSPGWEG